MFLKLKIMLGIKPRYTRWSSFDGSEGFQIDHLTGVMTIRSLPIRLG